MVSEPTFNYDASGSVLQSRGIEVGVSNEARADGAKTALGELSGTEALDKVPRTARGERTRRKLLDSALAEFGERGFSDGSIVGITQRAGVALGTFYNYFASKEEIFRAVVSDMSARVRDAVAPSLEGADHALDAERRALSAFLAFVRGHKAVYRIIDEAEFVDPEGFRQHYETTAARITRRLAIGEEAGALVRGGDELTQEVRAWAIMGANVFLGLRFGVWGNEDPEAVARIANELLSTGLRAG
jgi:AcrR family transcriptional regulator